MLLAWVGIKAFFAVWRLKSTFSDTQHTDDLSMKSLFNEKETMHVESLEKILGWFLVSAQVIEERFQFWLNLRFSLLHCFKHYYSTHNWNVKTFNYRSPDGRRHFHWFRVWVVGSVELTTEANYSNRSSNGARAILGQNLPVKQCIIRHIEIDYDCYVSSIRFAVYFQVS